MVSTEKPRPLFLYQYMACKPKENRIPEIKLNRNQKNSQKCEKEVDIRMLSVQRPYFILSMYAINVTSF